MKISLVITLILIGCEPVRVNPAGSLDSGLPVAAAACVGKIRVPDGCSRLPCKSGSFGAWLRKIPLKADTRVFLYNGRLKTNQEAQYAVMDISVGNKDLQQCADAVMRLRAEYLFDRKRFNEIVFKDNLGKKYAWTGGQDTKNFTKYLDRVFGMCGTASLEKQLLPQSMKDIAPGDVLIKGGFPGHAMMVVDVAVDKKGERWFMLAQSYMPAQDIHIVKNPGDKNNPWYHADELQPVVTPEWTFTSNHLRQW